MCLLSIKIIKLKSKPNKTYIFFECKLLLSVIRPVISIIKDFVTIICDHVGGSLSRNRKQILNMSNWSQNLSSGCLHKSSWNSIWLRNMTVIYKVVTYGRWSLSRSGHYERVDCRLLNVTYRLSDVNAVLRGGVINLKIM